MLAVLKYLNGREWGYPLAKGARWSTVRALLKRELIAPAGDGYVLTDKGRAALEAHGWKP
jgi:hypothetical protein